MSRLVILSIIFLFYWSISLAQLEKKYSARSTYKTFSNDFIKVYNQQLKLDFPDSLKIPNKNLINRINAKRQTVLVSQLKKGLFIKDDSLESFLAGILHNLEQANPFLSPRYRRVLILRNAATNAYCFGRGIFIANIGLLGRIENEDQLAFVVAHEMAHDELGHIRERILREANANVAKKTDEQFKKIMAGTVDPEEIEGLRNLIYGVTHHSRENELKADSMALILVSNAGYNNDETFSMLSILENSLKPKRPIDIDLFLPFDAIEYPFQVDWLDERLSLYSKERAVGLLGLKDSIGTHPEFEIRKERLYSNLRSTIREANYQDLNFVNDCIALAEFETVETAYQQNLYDWSMFYAMQLLNRYPNNAYLISRIGKMFIVLSEAKALGTFNLYVPLFTSYYSDELRWVNNFLSNMTATEMKQVAFYFLNNPRNFNRAEKSHYYLLKRICELTERNDLKKKTEQEFKSVFGKNMSSYTYD